MADDNQKMRSSQTRAGKRWLRRAVLALTVGAASHVIAAPWPQIAPFAKTYHFGDPAHMYLHEWIKDTHGREVYELECSTPSNPKASSSFSWSGQFECRIAMLGGANLPDEQLLVDSLDADRDWMSRGRFFANQLIGRCGEYPEYGRVRHFYFRKIAVTIRITDLQVTKNDDRDPEREFVHDLKAFTLEVTANPDPRAHRPVAGRTIYSEPEPVVPSAGGGRLDCSKVRFVLGRRNGAN